MWKSVISVGFTATCLGLGRLLLALLLPTERIDGATGLLLATGLFTIAIAAVVGK